MAKGKSTVGAFDIAPGDGARRPVGRAKVDRSIKSVHMDNDLKKPLKIAAIDEARSESDIVNQLLRGYLSENGYLGE